MVKTHGMWQHTPQRKRGFYKREEEYCSGKYAIVGGMWTEGGGAVSPETRVTGTGFAKRESDFGQSKRESRLSIKRFEK